MQAFGGRYEWLLWGDDDTMWFTPALQKMVAGLDPQMPYLITGEPASESCLKTAGLPECSQIHRSFAVHCCCHSECLAVVALFLCYLHLQNRGITPAFSGADHTWFCPPKGPYAHPAPMAPRCLPCGYNVSGAQALYPLAPKDLQCMLHACLLPAQCARAQSILNASCLFQHPCAARCSLLVNETRVPQ